MTSPDAAGEPVRHAATDPATDGATAGPDAGLVDLPATEDEWRVRLSPAEFTVLRGAGTEPAFVGEYVTTTTPGTYRCRACRAELFDSSAKFDSHCGWPSFDDAIPGSVIEVVDRSHGMARTEIRCARCDSHLGHVFTGEGYTPRNTRHCVNSLSIRLDPADDAQPQRAG